VANQIEQQQGNAELTTEQIRAQRKLECALGYRLLAAQKWGDLGDGHISARDPERTDCFWMLQYGVSYHAVTVSDLVLVGPDGQLVDGDGFVKLGRGTTSTSRFLKPDQTSSVRFMYTQVGERHFRQRRDSSTLSLRNLVYFLKITACGMMKKFRCKVSLLVGGLRRR
jgi:hypothetical protein